MDVTQLIKEYTRAQETDKVLEGQYQVLQNQLDKLLESLGMTYEEAVEYEKELQAKLKVALPKMQAYIKAVQEKKEQVEESLL